MDDAEETNARRQTSRLRRWRAGYRPVEETRDTRLVVPRWQGGVAIGRRDVVRQATRKCRRDLGVVFREGDVGSERLPNAVRNAVRRLRNGRLTIARYRDVTQSIRSLLNRPNRRCRALFVERHDILRATWRGGSIQQTIDSHVRRDQK